MRCFHCVKWNCLDAFSATQHRESAFIARRVSPPLLASSSRAISRATRSLFFFIVYFFAPRISACIRLNICARPSRTRHELCRACARVERDESVFLRERAFDRLRKYARNSPLRTSESERSESARSLYLLFYNDASTQCAPLRA